MSTKSTYIYSESLGFHLYQQALDYGRVWLELKKGHEVTVWLKDIKVELHGEVAIAIPKEVWNEIVKLGPMKIPEGYHNFNPKEIPDITNYTIDDTGHLEVLSKQEAKKEPE